MGLTPPELYWKIHNAQYPFQVVVPYMSPQDPNPREVQKKISFHFLRVPFGGQAYWGFLSPTDLANFKTLYNINDGEPS